MSTPSQDELAQAIAAAANSHHEFEEVYLGGERDKQRSGFYAAYVLGRLGDFVAPTTFSRWLEGAPGRDPWAASAAAYVIECLARGD